MNFIKRIYKDLELPLILYLIIFYTAHTLVAFFNLLRKRIYLDESELTYTLPQLIQIIGIDWILVITFMTFVSLIVKRFRRKNINWGKVLIINIFLSICMMALTQVVLDLQTLYFQKGSFQGYNIIQSLINTLNLIELYFLIFASLLFIIYIYYYIKELKSREQEKRELQEELVNAKLSILKSQMQPHFLFNTLNSISSLIDESRSKAQNTIADLSSFLRQVLNIGESNVVKLKVELDLLEKYIRIMKVRYGHHLEVNHQVDFECYQYKVPALMLQPIAENAIQHGYSRNHKTLKIDFRIKAEDNFLIIRAYNNGQLIEVNENVFNRGIGLSNLRQRLDKIYGPDASINIYNSINQIENGVVVDIKIPLK